MLIYHKYLFKNVATTSAFLSVVFTFIVWLIRIIRHLDVVINKGIELGKFTYVSILLLPPIFFLIIPIAVFISILYVLFKLINTSELIVLKSSGASIFGISKPVIWVAVIATVINLFNAFFIMPLASKQWSYELKNLDEKYFFLLVEPGVFLQPIHGLTIFIHDRDDKGMLKNIFVNDSRNSKSNVSIFAKEGNFIKTEQGTVLFLIDGNRQEVDHSGNFHYLSFKEITYNLLPDKKASSVTSNRIDQKSIYDLLFQETGDTTIDKKMRCEANHKINWPMQTLSLAIIALLSCICGSLTRGELMRQISFASVFSIGFVFVLFVVNNLAFNFLPLLTVNYILLIAMLIIGYNKLYKHGS